MILLLYIYHYQYYSAVLFLSNVIMTDPNGSWICYIITEGFFFILSFFVGYILSFGLVRLRTIRLSARAGAHIECSSRLRVENEIITNAIIKTPERK